MKIFLLILTISLFSSIHGDDPEEVKVGDVKEIDVDDQEATKLLTENLARIDTGDLGMILVSKEKVTKQMVSGISYKIYGTFKIADRTLKCVISIWSRVWLDDKNEATKIRAECEGNKWSVKGESFEWKNF